MHVETSFRWNLGDLICVRRHVGPAQEGNSRTMGMHAGEESDGCIVPVKPRTMPSDIGGGDGGRKAAGRGEGELRRMPRTQRRNQHVTEAASPRIGAAWVPIPRRPITFDPRQEPGALAAHAGICAGGEEQSSSLPRPSVAWTGCDAASSSGVRAEAAVEGKDAHRTLVAAGLGSCARGRPPCETIVGSF